MAKYDKEAIRSEVISFLEHLKAYLVEERFDAIVDELYEQQYVEREKDIQALHAHKKSYIAWVSSALLGEAQWHLPDKTTYAMGRAVCATFQKKHRDGAGPYLTVRPISANNPKTCIVPFVEPKAIKPLKLTPDQIALEKETGLSGQVWKQVLRLKGERISADPEKTKLAKKAGLSKALTVFHTEIQWPEHKAYRNKDVDDPDPVPVDGLVFVHDVQLDALVAYPCCKGRKQVLLGHDNAFLMAAPLDDNDDPDPLIDWVDHEWIGADDVLEEPIRLSWFLAGLKAYKA